VKIPHSTFYPPFRKHFHIFEFHILLSAVLHFTKDSKNHVGEGSP